MSARCVLCFAIYLCSLACALPSVEGAPFTTDDPQMPDRGGLEFDLAARYSARQGEESGALPYFEIDYGLTAHLALHALGANAFLHRDGERRHLGYGDTEFGAKYRFLDQEEGGSPVSAAIYPTFLAQTGDEARGLGNGHARLFLPLWIQREIDSWRIFGGGGYWFNHGAGNQNFAFVGIGVLHRIDASWSLGGEVFHVTADQIGGRDATGFNLGATYDISAQHHVLFSGGRGLRNATSTNTLSMFLGYQMTL